MACHPLYVPLLNPANLKGLVCRAQSHPVWSQSIAWPQILWMDGSNRMLWVHILLKYSFNRRLTEVFEGCVQQTNKQKTSELDIDLWPLYRKQRYYAWDAGNITNWQMMRRALKVKKSTKYEMILTSAESNNKTLRNTPSKHQKKVPKRCSNQFQFTWGSNSLMWYCPCGWTLEVLGGRKGGYSPWKCHVPNGAITSYQSYEVISIYCIMSTLCMNV